MEIHPLLVRTDIDFAPVVNKVRRVAKANATSASAVYVIRGEEVICETYDGIRRLGRKDLLVEADSRFNVYSVRKSYIGLVVAWTIYKGLIKGVDEKLSSFVPEPTEGLFADTTIRHLITHTHGLDEVDRRMIRRFAPGSKWHYTNTGIRLLSNVVEEVSGKTVAAVLDEEVFKPLGFEETAWETVEHVNQVHDVQGFKRQAPLILSSDRGDDRNLYVSARELALWGYLHLRKGLLGGIQVMAPEVFDMVSSVQSPSSLDRRFPQHGFCWWVKPDSGRLFEIGGKVPAESFQILGMSGCLCLCIPSLDVVAVRMYNNIGGNRLTFGKEAREFGNQVVQVIENH